MVTLVSKDSGGNTFPGDIDVGGNVILTAGGDITTTLNGNIRLLPNGTGITQIGNAGVPVSLGAINDNILITGQQETLGLAFFRGGIQTNVGHSTFHTNLTFADDKFLIFGSPTKSLIKWSTGQTPDALVWGLDSVSRNLILCENGDVNIDFGVPLSANPQLVIQSSDATTPAQRLRIRHKQTNPVFESDTGVCQFPEGIRTIFDNSNVSSPPTDAELDTAFGTPQTVGDGFVGLIDDNDADTDVWLCVARDDGAIRSWWYTALTKAI